MLETIIVLVCIAIDQVTKFWAENVLTTLPGMTYPVIQDVFHLTFVQNRGAAFGILQNQRPFFIIATLLFTTIVITLMIKERKKMGLWMRAGLALMLAGAMGNFIDRMALHYVRDFFDFRLIRFAVFNVADSCLTVAVVIIGICMLISEKRLRDDAKNGKTGEDDLLSAAKQDS